MAYCRFDVDCVQVEHQSHHDYARALLALTDAKDEEMESLRQAAYSIVPMFDVGREREQFAALLAEIR
jgi:hypothetical protein